MSHAPTPMTARSRLRDDEWLEEPAVLRRLPLDELPPRVAEVAVQLSAGQRPGRRPADADGVAVPGGMELDVLQVVPLTVRVPVPELQRDHRAVRGDAALNRRG